MQLSGKFPLYARVSVCVSVCCGIAFEWIINVMAMPHIHDGRWEHRHTTCATVHDDCNGEPKDTSFPIEAYVYLLWFDFDTLSVRLSVCVCVSDCIVLNRTMRTTEWNGNTHIVMANYFHSNDCFMYIKNRRSVQLPLPKGTNLHSTRIADYIQSIVCFSPSLWFRCGWWIRWKWERSTTYLCDA